MDDVVRYGPRLEDRLTRQERIIFDLIKSQRGQFISTERICDFLYSDDDDPPLWATTVIKVTVHRLRRKLIGSSFIIESRWGQGYRLALLDPLEDA